VSASFSLQLVVVVGVYRARTLVDRRDTKDHELGPFIITGVVEWRRLIARMVIGQYAHCIAAVLYFR